MLMVYISGGIIGLGYGFFMACSWALGTELVPASESGKYLGISNLAGAGAGIVELASVGLWRIHSTPLLPGWDTWSFMDLCGIDCDLGGVLVKVKDPGKKAGAINPN